MATRKITITLDEQDVKKIRGLVATGRAASVSGFAQSAITTALHDVAGWGAMLSGALAQTGGPLTETERAWADGVLAEKVAKEKRRGNAA